MYKIETASRRVERQIDKLPLDAQERVLEAIASLADNLRPVGVKSSKTTSTASALADIA